MMQMAIANSEDPDQYAPLANSADPDQTSPPLFAKTCLSENLGSLG